MSRTGASNLNTGETDPFANLHKMSTTAGLGSGDYVAINGAAIAAILLGVGSALVLFNSLYFLVIPLLGIILGILAFVQISKSNGTQTGREIAAVGLLLSLGLGGFSSAKTLYTVFHQHDDEEQIVSLVHHLGKMLAEKKYDSAYSLFDSQFRKHVTLTDFSNNWQRLIASPVIGPIQSIDWNQLLSHDVDPVTGEKISNGQMKMQTTPREPLRISMSFRNEDGNWLVDQIPEIFPQQEASAQKPAAGSPSQAGAPRGGLMGPPKPH